ncbi:MAG: DNA/RNA non-specific endonuclease [Comamonas sp.]
MSSSRSSSRSKTSATGRARASRGAASPVSWLTAPWTALRGSVLKRLGGRLGFLLGGLVLGSAAQVLPGHLALGGWAQRDWREWPAVLAALADESVLQPLRELGLSLRQEGGTPKATSTPSAQRDAQALLRAMRPGQDFAECASQFPASVAMSTAEVSPRWLPQALCFDGFAVMYSGLTRTPLFVVERLDAAALGDASAQSRTDEFFADERIAAGRRAELSDYARSGYDRGHMAAAANRASTAAMVQSFALSNMVPQDPENNRKVWADLEADVRKFVRRASGPVYVFTGPVFDAHYRTVGGDRVWVPAALFKLVYDDKNQRAWGYVLPNTAEARLGAPMDYAAFVQRTGWQLLQAVPVRGSVVR